MERILVIGNGFNLDLGLTAVGYSAFFLSKEWEDVRTQHAQSRLIRFLIGKVEKKEYSIESILTEYAKKCPCLYCMLFGNRDKRAYYDLEKAFQKYVANGVNNAKDKIRRDSAALKVWKEFEDMKRSNIIDVYNLYSFNYVLLEDIADMINGDNAQWEFPQNLVFPDRISVDYIHGRTDGNRNGGSIILGIDEAPKKCFSYMEKRKNQAFMPQKSGYLQKSLINASYIEIFGIGFWPEDGYYFRSFFDSFKDKTFAENKTIIVYDYNSKAISELKERIKQLVDNDWETYSNIINAIEFRETIRTT